MKLKGLRNKLSIGVPWIVIILLVGMNVLLIVQNLKLRFELDSFKPNILQPGDRVRAFSSQGLNGEAIDVNYTGKETTRILLYFTPA